jgi:cobalamin biosynthesis protein CbiG
LPEKRKAQPGEEAASPPAYAIGAFIGHHGQKRISKKLGCSLGKDLTITVSEFELKYVIEDTCRDQKSRRKKVAPVSNIVRFGSQVKSS